MAYYHRRRLQVLVAALLLSGVLFLTVLAQSTTWPPCDEDGHSYPMAEGETTIGTVSTTATPCSGYRSLDIVSNPASPSLIAPFAEWNYILTAQTADHTSGSISFTVNALCDEAVVCQATITYRLTGENPVMTTTTAAPATPPDTLPQCSSSNSMTSFAQGETGQGTFPLDQQDSACAYTVTLLDQPSTGLAVVLEMIPLTYLYSAPITALDVKTSFPYQVACNEVAICNGTANIWVHEVMPTCPQGSLVVNVNPGSQASGLMNTGASCTGALTARVRQSSGEGSLTFSAGQNYLFTAPGYEVDASYTVRTYCDEVPLCETTMLFRVAQPTSPPTASPPATTSTPTTNAPQTSTPPPVGPISLPPCSTTTSLFSTSQGNPMLGAFPLDLSDSACTYTATITDQPSVGLAVVLDEMTLGFLYSSPADAYDVNTSFPYEVECNTLAVCNGTVNVWVHEEAPPCPASPLVYSVQPGAQMSGALDIGAWCGSGVISSQVRQSNGQGSLVLTDTLMFIFTAPNTEVDAEYTVRTYCGAVPLCQSTVVFLVTAPGPTTTSEPVTSTTQTPSVPPVVTTTTAEPTPGPTQPPTLPQCSVDTTPRSVAQGTTSTSALPVDLQDSACVYSSRITSQPSIGSATLLGSSQPLGFEYTAPATAYDGNTTVSYEVSCNGVVVCTGVVNVWVHEVAPTCPQGVIMMEVKPNSQQSGVISTGATCSSGVLTSRVRQTNNRGTLVFGAGQNYIFSAPSTETDAIFTVRTYCDGAVVCESQVVFLVSDITRQPTQSPTTPPADLPQCSTLGAVHTYAPGGTSTGILPVDLQDGACVYSASLLTQPAVGSAAVLGSALPLGYVYTSPRSVTSATTSFTYEVACNGVPVCRSVLGIAVSGSGTTASPGVRMCPEELVYRVPTSQTVRGTINVNLGSSCYLTTYKQRASGTTAGGNCTDDRIDVNLIGDFLYKAPPTQTVETVTVDVYCITTFACRASMLFAVYADVEPTVTTTTVSPVTNVTCANVYYYQTAPGVALSTSLNGVPGQDPCAHGRYFSLSTSPQAGALDMMPVGDFLYRPPSQEGTYYFTFYMYCLNKLYCAGMAYILVSNRWTLPPPTTTPTGTPAPVVITNPQITCRGTCNERAWLTYPKPPMWDNTAGTGAARKDGNPADGLSVNWANSSLVFTVYTLIGNLGVRFPTFEPILSSTKRTSYFEPADFTSTVSATSPGFEMSCLAGQGRIGMGEDVWKWQTLSEGMGTGHVGALYNSGESWYQKFGGKHVQCDTFADPCRYAPLLTPANASANPSLGRWTVDIDDCDATWTGVFSYGSLEKLKKANGEPVWAFVGDRQVKGALLTEAVRAHSWVSPGHFDTNYNAHDIIITLKQFVNVEKTGPADAPFSIDAEFFEYDNENGDFAFGLNMLFYPSVTSTMSSNYAADRHVMGFKWIEQTWTAPDAEQCPTCTGTRMHCTSAGQYASSTYVGPFPTGDCPAGVARVQLMKGPAMEPGQCEPNEMHVFSQPGISAPRNCKLTFQNLTLRGVVPGSGGLSETLTRAFNYEGTINLQLLMTDGSKENVDLTLTMYVTRLSQDTAAAAGGLMACRSGSYWPVLDPLGTSTPDRPFSLSVTTPSVLCRDDLSSTYGPNDWALFTLSLPGVHPSQVIVHETYVSYNGTRVYLQYKDPSTGVSAIPPATTGNWWQYTQPYFAFRDLTSRAVNETLSTSPEMAAANAVHDVVYAFLFIPGSIGVDTAVEVVVEATVTQDGQTSRTTFRRVLHVDPLLTQLSREGPPKPTNDRTIDNSKSDLYAIGATAAVAVVLVVTAIFFMLADNDRPLPKWVPRGKVIKKTVLSMLPPNLRGKKKQKRVVHKDMYDAMKSGAY